MKPLTLVLLALAAVATVAAVELTQLPEARLTVQVVDEDGRPMPEARVALSFSTPVLPGQGAGVRGYAVEGLSDNTGRFSGAGRTLPEAGFQVQKAGYYGFSGSAPEFTKSEMGRWQPYDQTVTAVLKKRGTPAPMYARTVTAFFPVEAWPVGFDLIAADWVAPYGRGTTADFIFRVDRAFRGPGDYDVKASLTFTNPADGVQEFTAKHNVGSDLRLPRLAPAAGYLPAWNFGVQMATGYSAEGDEREDRNFLFRVRSVVRDGQVVSALYGKIHGDFHLGGSAGAKVGVIFCYYLNPDGTRNLENGGASLNLFGELESSERPR